MKRPKGLKYKKHKENPTSFKKGGIPWNKGKQGSQVAWNKGTGKGYINTHGYLILCINGKERLAHREIWKKYHKTIPRGYIIHHIDGNKLNNDISNLQAITRSQHSKLHYEEKRHKFRRKKKCV